MQIGLKMLIAAVCSLSIGVAFASPLLISDLNIRPYITRVQGPTADFKVEVVYANFTVLDAEKPIADEDGPSLLYQIVLNVTNLANIGADLTMVDFGAAGKITSTSSPPFINNSMRGTGWTAPGAWVDGVWYNVTWVNVTAPLFDSKGNLRPSLVTVPKEQCYWMEGVQVYEKTVNNANGSTTSTYLNMNGTWTDVTGRIQVWRPGSGTGGGWSFNNIVAEKRYFFQNTPHEDVNSPLSTSIFVLTGEGNFDNNWKPHESRFIAVQSSGKIAKHSGNAKALEVLNSGTIALKASIQNLAEPTMVGLVNNTYQDTSSITNDVEQISLTKLGNSYVYNRILSDNQMFQPDKWGVEVFVRPRS
jgi:hypothetical protein